MLYKRIMLKRIEDSLNKIEETVSVVLFLTIIAVVVWSVLCRYALKIPFLSGEELARYLMIYCVYMGTSIGVTRKAHIGVEFFVQILPDKAKKNVQNIAEFLSMCLFAILFILSLIMTKQFIETGQIATVTKVPMYLIYSCIPVSMLLSTFHAFCNLYLRREISKEGI